MTDLVHDLRWPRGLSGPDDHPISVALRIAAADEIERLRTALVMARHNLDRIVTEYPVNHGSKFCLETAKRGLRDSALPTPSSQDAGS